MKTLRGVVAIAAAICILTGGATARQEGASRLWDAKDTAQAGQLTIYNTDEQGSLLGMPVGAGDIDGDGFDDVVLAPFYAPSGATNNRLGGGDLHVYFGSEDLLSGTTIDAAAPPPRSFEVWGARSGDFLGTEVAVDDVTGDGFADILACAENADGFDADTNRNQAGALYIIPGGPAMAGPVNLSSPSGVIQVLGAAPGDRFGFWVAAGDVTGDGIKDVLVSADLAKGQNGQGRARGALYIIPGGPALPARIDLGNAGQVRALNITTVYGVDDDDHLGSSIASGDFDGDGIGDVAVGAGLSRSGAGFTGHNQSNNALGVGGGDGPTNDRENSGEVYVLYGRAVWPETIALANPPADVGIYYGEAPSDYFGEDVRAGDVDGDGRDELAVGALLADAPGRSASGIGYVFWSATLARGDRVDTRQGANAFRMTKIYGERQSDIGSDSIVLADLDSDGYSDILFGSPNNSPASRGTAGDLKIIYGSEDRLPPVVDTAQPPATVPVFQIIAPDQGDMFCYSLTYGDVDGDGFFDIVANAMGGDGAGNRSDLAGDAYVISGRLFSARAGRGSLAAPTLSRVLVSPSRKRYYAGEMGIELSLLSDAPLERDRFKPGAVAIITGIEVPTEFVSTTELRVRLDDAPEVRNRAGSLLVQARNAESGPSAGVLSITLTGPNLKKVRVKQKASGFDLKVKGNKFLDGARVGVALADGTVLEPASVVRRNAKLFVVHVEEGAVEPGTELVVTVYNPGPAPSEPITVTAP